MSSEANRLLKSPVVLAHCDCPCDCSSICERCSHVEYGDVPANLPSKVYLKGFLSHLLKFFANIFSDFVRLKQLDRILVFHCESYCGKRGSIKPDLALNGAGKPAFAWNARCFFNGISKRILYFERIFFRLIHLFQLATSSVG